MWIASEAHYQVLLHRLNQILLTNRAILANQESMNMTIQDEFNDLKAGMDALTAAVGVAVGDIAAEKASADALTKQVADLQAQLANGVPVEAGALEGIATQAKSLAENLTAAHAALSTAAPAPAAPEAPAAPSEPPANQPA